MSLLPELSAQTKPDEDAVRRLPQSFSDAWARHDGHELANIMADDVDFVTVATTYLHGRADFEKFHLRLLGGRFKESEHHTARDNRAVSAAGYRGCSLEVENRS